MTEHTKTSWGIDKDPDTGELYLYGGDVIDPTNGEVSQPIIATLSNNSPVDDANAAHIVKCVNAHEDLEDAVRYSLGLLQEVYETIDADQNDPNGIYADIGTAIDKCNMALDTLAKVKGA